MPPEERPRKRLYHVGERALSTTELLAVVIGTGHGNDNVLQLAQLLLAETDGLPGLARASTHELRQVKGIGEVKAAQIKAALEAIADFVKKTDVPMVIDADGLT